MQVQLSFFRLLWLLFVAVLMHCATPNLLRWYQVAGSAYTYSYTSIGEFFAWIIGWDLILEYSVGAATVAISWSQYLIKFLSFYGIHIPTQLALSPFEAITLADGSIAHGFINLPAILVVLAITLVIIRGVGLSSVVTSVIVILKVGIVLTFIAVGWHYINPANYHPFIPSNTGTFGEYGISGIFRGAGVIFFVFIGFDIVATMAQETKNPQKNMPIGIIGSLIILYYSFHIVCLCNDRNGELSRVQRQRSSGSHSYFQNTFRLVVPINYFRYPDRLHFGDIGRFDGDNRGSFFR